MAQTLAGRRALAVAALLRQIEAAFGVRTMYLTFGPQESIRNRTNDGDGA